jgi:hypothetical protein
MGGLSKIQTKLRLGRPFQPGIGVDRYTPVFQTGIESALLSCPSILRDAKSRCRSGLHRPGCGGSTPPSCRGPCGRPPRVASIAAMQRSLKPQSTGQHRGDPPI